MYKNKPLILVFNKYYLPGYRAGGPIRTLSNIVERLGEEFDFRIVALDRDAGSNEPYAGIAHDQWKTVGKAQVMYLNPKAVTHRQLTEIILATAPDLVYLNSFFDATFTQRVLLARRLRSFGNLPVILAPRGEFSDGALRLKKTKKKIYLYASNLAGLYRNLVWQASSMLEGQDIQRNLRYVNPSDIQVAMDLAPTGEGLTIGPSARAPGEPLRLCFLSRISPIKNLDFALRLLANVRAQVVFTIYGPKAVPAYWAKCERLIEDLPSNVKVIYGDEVHPTEVQRSLAQHDIFLFPTRGENYGHVIHEALGSGLPVLISDQTPWSEVVERGVGWALALDSESEFARIVDAVALWSDEKVLSVRRAATDYARECAVDPAVLNSNRALFWHAMNAAES